MHEKPLVGSVWHQINARPTEFKSSVKLLRRPEDRGHYEMGRNADMRRLTVERHSCAAMLQREAEKKTNLRSLIKLSICSPSLRTYILSLLLRASTI